MKKDNNQIYRWHLKQEKNDNAYEENYDWFYKSPRNKKLKKIERWITPYFTDYIKNIWDLLTDRDKDFFCSLYISNYKMNKEFSRKGAVFISNKLLNDIDNFNIKKADIVCIKRKIKIKSFLDVH